MRYIYCDLEATCEENDRSWDMEIIEIGAVMTDTIDGGVISEFGNSQFVKPIVNPTLTNFCKNLTTIKQEDVDNADPLPVVLKRFVDWCGTEPFVWCSWGLYDKKQIQKDCARHGIEFPVVLENHRNLKDDYEISHGHKRFGMAKALNTEGIVLDGTHHRGIDDARNTAKLGRLILPRIKQLEAEKDMIIIEVTGNLKNDDPKRPIMQNIFNSLQFDGFDVILESNSKIKVRRTINVTDMG